MPLPPSLAYADGFRWIEFGTGEEFGVNQPCGLRQEGQEQQSGEKLRTSETFACEIWTHKAEPSVLPCRRLFAEKDCNERVPGTLPKNVLR